MIKHEKLLKKVNFKITLKKFKKSHHSLIQMVPPRKRESNFREWVREWLWDWAQIRGSFSMSEKKIQQCFLISNIVFVLGFRTICFFYQILLDLYSSTKLFFNVLLIRTTVSICFSPKLTLVQVPRLINCLLFLLRIGGGRFFLDLIKGCTAAWDYPTSYIIYSVKYPWNFNEIFLRQKKPLF